MKRYSKAWLVKVKKTAKRKLTKIPLPCKVCKHDMGLSRVKMTADPWTVRCNNCKSVHEVSLKFPEDKPKSISAGDYAQGM